MPWAMGRAIRRDCAALDVKTVSLHRRQAMGCAMTEAAPVW